MVGLVALLALALVAEGSATNSWRMVDMGTLGGRDSAAIALNEHSQVVGSSEAANGERHAFLWEGGRITDLGRLSGAGLGNTWLELWTLIAINEHGQIVWNQPGRRAGVLWEKGRLRHLGFEVSAINDRGQVVGCDLSAPEPHPLIWQNGHRRDLGTLPGDGYGCAEGINGAGDVVGYSSRSSYSGPVRAFLWRHGRMQELGRIPGYRNALSFAVNAVGDVLGQAQEPTGNRATEHPFLWQQGRMRDVGVLPGGWGGAYAHALNDRGEVVGQSGVGGHDHAFMWANGLIQDLGTLGGWRAVAGDINNSSEVVGWSDTDARNIHAFVWERGRMTDLGRAGRYTRSQALAINNKGVIAGVSRIGLPSKTHFTDPPRHAVLWIPRSGG